VIDGPDQADEGDTVSLDANGSIDLDGEITRYEWDLDDDSSFDDATGHTASVTFDDDGTYTIGLRVTDDDGETDVATKIITVFNVAPTVNLTANPETAECNIDEVTITATVTDPGSADTHSIIWDFGDSSGQIGGWEAHHTYDGCGEFTVTTLVEDDDGATGFAEVIITVVDTTPPDVAVVFPGSDQAVQDGITLTATASDNCGLGTVRFYVREADGASGIPVGFEDLPTVLDGDQWKADFDSTLLDDGCYVALARAEDASGNENWSESVPFSICNWAVLELLPASKANKAGRTMPVKFSLRITESVDPAKPFVYNEDLEIRICEMGNLGAILQTSAFGDSSRDYRIDSSGELYIANFKTKKQPAHYTVKIIRPNHNDFLVGSFSFETVK
jgi:PKD repeat protein